MTATIVTLTVLALLVWVLVRGHRSGRRPFRQAQFRPGVPFHGLAPEDADHARLIAELRALPDAPADVETRIRT